MVQIPKNVSYFDSANPVGTGYLNTSRIEVSQNDLFCVVLPYDQKAGPRWRIAVTDGLFIEKERYLSYPEGIIAPTDGVMEWYVRATRSGEESFIATSRIRSGSPDYTQTRYTLNVIISHQV